jgi:hypothetical protein
MAISLPLSLLISLSLSLSSLQGRLHLSLSGVQGRLHLVLYTGAIVLMGPGRSSVRIWRRLVSHRLIWIRVSRSS